MTGFTLLQDDPLYLKVTTPDPNAGLINGVWYNGVPTITYTEFEGIFEPYGKGDYNRILPEGVSSSAAINVFTEQLLDTHLDLEDATKASIIYIEDPELNQKAYPYVIFYKMPWTKNKGFSLLTGHLEYVAIRQEKL